MVSSQAIQAMKSMATDTRKRAILMKDTTCVGGLVLVLSNPDEAVVKLALETILCLAEGKEHRPTLRNFIGMMDQVQCLCERPGDVGKLARDVAQVLSPDDQITPLKDTFNTSCNVSRRRSSIQRALQGGFYKFSKTIILQLKGLMNKCDRDVCMRLLLKVKGVISITFDMNKKRCIVRTKPDVRPENLVHAIAKTQSVYAQQVVKSETGEELLLSFGLHEASCNNNKSNNYDDSQLPDYLPEDEEEPVDDKALARNASETKGGSWFNTAANFLTNSFYW